MNKNPIVMFFTNDDDDIENKFWHLIDPANPAGHATLCTGEFFGIGESNVVFTQMQVKLIVQSVLLKYKYIKR